MFKIFITHPGPDNKYHALVGRSVDMDIPQAMEIIGRDEGFFLERLIPEPEPIPVPAPPETPKKKKKVKK
jgi:hypothetical protein